MADITRSATARAHANIAFVKYWGNRDQRLRLPANASISMNLADLHTTTTVEWSAGLKEDRLTLNGAAATGAPLQRVRAHLDVMRERLQRAQFARVDSSNNFPMGTGIASSASAFAALTVAACATHGVDLSERELSCLARMGSGSAARSIPAGFVEWHAADAHEDSFAESFAPPQHWNLVDVVAIVSRDHKRVGSSAGHEVADSSVFQSARVRSAAERNRSVKAAIMKRDFERFAGVVEEDSNLMHAVMMTGKPPLFYWAPLSLTIMQAVRSWRLEDNLQVCYTLDAGPNVHCICTSGAADAVTARLRALSGDIEVLRSGPGSGAFVMPTGQGQT